MSRGLYCDDFILIKSVNNICNIHKIQCTIGIFVFEIYKQVFLCPIVGVNHPPPPPKKNSLYLIIVCSLT